MLVDVRVRIDHARDDELAPRVHDAPGDAPPDHGLDAGDPAVGDPHVHHRIHSPPGVEHAPATHHDIETVG